MEYRLIEDLIALRKKKNITQVELSKISGLTQQQISKIERRANSPTLAILAKYCEGIGVELVLRDERS